MAKTKSGFEYELNEGLEENFELFELFREYQKTQNVLILIDVAKLLLGEEGYKRLKEHHTKDGKTSAKGVFEDIMEISNDDSKIKK